MKFIVPVVYKGRSNFLVEAETTEDAARKALEAFADGEEPTICGNEWEVSLGAGEPETIEADGR